MAEPLLVLERVSRRFASGEGGVTVLDDVSLDIQAGEMVAIVGASGSGKSTLMNLLGCLDRPSEGCYRVDGIDVSTLDADELARLRREHFGFVFQRYHLLPHLDALDNVALPAVYAGYRAIERRARAAALLLRLGLAGHAGKRSNQLSGGQQQRVSIARALMNGGAVILADEPTGALDRHSGQEVLTILRELHQAGHTVIIVTHDRQVAAAAQRIVELVDGRVSSDSGGSVVPTPACHAARPAHAAAGGLTEALKMALFALWANRLRSLLTMLGIVIGIAAVVTVVALGQGARDAVLDDIRGIGTNTVFVYRGRDWGDDKAGSIETLRASDLSILAAEPYVDSVTPLNAVTMRLRWRQADVNADVYGGGAGVFRAQGLSLAEGRGFLADEVHRQAQVAVLDPNLRRRLFGTRQDVLGQVVLIGSMPATVIGVTAPEHSRPPKELTAWVPYTTAASRLSGHAHFSMLSVRIRDGVSMALAERQMTRLLTILHGSKDFFTHSMDAVYRSTNRITTMLSLLLSLVAAISLLVGGIGVMNIMLVSVTERTREIGIRMAIGARQRDVRRQFLIESVLVCLGGGMLGIVVALVAGTLLSLVVEFFAPRYSWWAFALALFCSMAVGVCFGLLPARKAARLDPVEALARE
ncbi:MacB family efflux pump subunit [Paludibacterium purpuratum]|uniref:Macrolide transport system ATP-binding/permease protein n=1 Tax=Paludibacterium purpuratum TaxID=1144873 RepID=A0A4R7B3F8_9NEIS|nr:MacB family efflux pump subunit [Paludibacterium purpuratum]TDR78338.1 macrolide transport system ATP-binding/permease protein [Paludibacterium purpuratum]